MITTRPAGVTRTLDGLMIAMHQPGVVQASDTKRELTQSLLAAVSRRSTIALLATQRWSSSRCCRAAHPRHEVLAGNQLHREEPLAVLDVELTQPDKVLVRHIDERAELLS